MSYNIGMVIETFGHFDYARIAAESFLASIPEALLIIVDDGSPDWSTDWMDGLDTKRIIAHHFQVNERSGAKCRNYGYRMMKDMDIDVSLAGSSDVIFPKNWFKPFPTLLERGWKHLGPITNAPGSHNKRQFVTHYVDAYVLTDDTNSINQTFNEVFNKYSYSVMRNMVNGFVEVSLTEVRASNDYLDEVNFPMEGTEDDYYRRLFKLSNTTRPDFKIDDDLAYGIALGSFVFHYRGVSRGNTDVGYFRKD